MDVLYFVYYLSLVWSACGRIAGDFQSILEAVPGDGTISQKAEPDGDGLTVHLPDCPLYEETAAPEEAPEPLEAPAIFDTIYDEMEGSMVLTVEGDWESCIKLGSSFWTAQVL